jgi:hypothetical protein
MSRPVGAVLVMAAGRSPEAGPSPDPDELEELLGPRRRAELQADLQMRAIDWARQVAPENWHAATPGASLSAEAARVFVQEARTLLVVWPSLPRLRRDHAEAALEDLHSGADVVLGPVIDDGLYLLGLSQPAPALLERLDEALTGGELGTFGISAASDLGLELGLLRIERSLRTVADVAAALADPLTPPETRRLLAGEDDRGSRPDRRSMTG